MMRSWLCILGTFILSSSIKLVCSSPTGRWLGELEELDPTEDVLRQIEDLYSHQPTVDPPAHDLAALHHPPEPFYGHDQHPALQSGHEASSVFFHDYQPQLSGLGHQPPFFTDGRFGGAGSTSHLPEASNSNPLSYLVDEASSSIHPSPHRPAESQAESWTGENAWNPTPETDQSELSKVVTQRVTRPREELYVPRKFVFGNPDSQIARLMTQWKRKAPLRRLNKDGTMERMPIWTWPEFQKVDPYSRHDIYDKVVQNFDLEARKVWFEKTHKFQLKKIETARQGAFYLTHHASSTWSEGKKSKNHPRATYVWIKDPQQPTIMIFRGSFPMRADVWNRLQNGQFWNGDHITEFRPIEHRFGFEEVLPGEG